MVNPKTFKTLEFLLLVVSNLAGWLVVLASSLPDRWGIYITAVSGGLYAFARGQAKHNADVKDYWHTTEFYVSLITSAPAIIGAFSNVIDVKTYTVVQGLIVALTGIAMGQRKDPQVAAGNITAADALGELDLLVTDDSHDPADEADDSLLAGTAADPAAGPPPPIATGDSGK